MKDDKKSNIRTYLKGFKFFSNEGYEFEVIGVLKDSKRLIKTTKEPFYEVIVCTSNIKKGTIRNPFRQNVFDRGFIGVGKYDSTNSKINDKDFYDTWSKMFDRCYRGKDLNYTNVEVCEDWYNFQNFMEYVMKTFPSHIKNENFVLEKDILQYDLKNKIYSPNTTLWIPKRINSYIQNKRSGTNNEIKGVQKRSENSWRVTSVLFENPSKNYNIGSYKTKEEAQQAYINFKLEQDIKARDYLCSLNYLPEEIIQLVRTV